jgi:hypothetical protein
MGHFFQRYSYILIILIILTRRHGNFAGVHTLLRILLSSNSAVLINIITGVSPPHFYYYTYFVCICYFFLTSQHFEYEFIIKFLYKQALSLFKLNLLVI